MFATQHVHTKVETDLPTGFGGGDEESHTCWRCAAKLALLTGGLSAIVSFARLYLGKDNATAIFRHSIASSADDLRMVVKELDASATILSDVANSKEPLT